MRFCTGVSLSGVIISAMTYLVSFTNAENRTKILTINTAGAAIFSNVSLLIGGMLIEVSIRFTFWTQSILFIIVMIVFNLILPKPQQHTLNNKTDSSLKNSLSYSQLFKIYSRKLISVACVASITMMSGTLIVTTLNTILSYDFSFAL